MKKSNWTEFLQKPRKCIITRTPFFKGFGFSTYVKEGGISTYVKDVGDNSPAQLAKLLPEDRIIEVNGINVERAPHSDIALAISIDNNRIELIVTDLDTDIYFQHSKNYDINTAILHEMIDVHTNNADVLDVVDMDIDDQEDALHDNDITTVVLVKEKSDSYGFQLKLVDNLFIVCGVRAKSVAENCGLKYGDIVLQINSDILKDMHTNFVTEIINSKSDKLTLYVLFKKPITPCLSKRSLNIPNSPNKKVKYEVDFRYKNHVDASSVLDGHEDFKTITHPILSQNVIETEPHKCILYKLPTFSGYGFKLVSVKEGNIGHFISTIQDRSPAFIAGLRRGDKLLDINGTEVDDLKLDGVRNLIKNSDENKLIFNMLSYKSVNDDNNSSKELINLPKLEKLLYNIPRDCVLHRLKDFCGYGFQILELPGQKGHFVHDIENDSPAKKAGLVEQDYIISVNGINVEKLAHEEVIESILENSSQVKMHVISLSDEKENVESNDITTSQIVEACSDALHTTSEVDLKRKLPEITMKNEIYAWEPSDEFYNVDPSKMTIKFVLEKPCSSVGGYGFIINVSKSKSKSTLIEYVNHHSIAFHAGLRAKDTIIEINSLNTQGLDIASIKELIAEFSNHVELLVLRRKVKHRNS